MIKRLLLSMAVLACWGQAAFAAQTDVRSVSLSTGWEFVRGDLGSAWEAFRPAKKGNPESVPLWTAVSLPHCYNATDAVNPYENYYQGPAWYRQNISIDNPYQGGRTLLHFSGAGQKTAVYVYTEKVAEHIGGYDEWDADITEAVEAFKRSEAAQRFKGLVPIAIRCDNSRDVEMIPSDMSDFFLYGGIYRPLSLCYVPQNHLSAPIVSTTLEGRKATVSVQFSTYSTLKGTAQLSIVAPNGSVVAQARTEVAAQPEGQSHTLSVEIKRPELWSPASPNLYSCSLSLLTGSDKTTERTRFGIRSIEFVEKGPFLLNGKRVLLRGTHRHEDHAGMGSAVPDSITRHDFIMMKNMGVNFIRLAHYQQSAYILDLCDSLGIMAWEEIPWCRGGVGGKSYRRQARQMLTNMITQHRNHPAVILWGLGNEIDWPGDFETFSKDSIRSFLSELNQLSHSLDSSRPTCIRRCDFARDIVDVYSPSIWAGWYKNTYRDYMAMEREGFDKTNRFIHVEWGGDSHAGRHAESNTDGIKAADKNGDWSESYIVKLFDWHLKEQENMPWLSGCAFWTFKDFATPLRPRNPIPYINQKGVVQRDGTPKESYYVFQSYWTTKPMLRIYGHSWPVRWGAEGEQKEVLVYSNCHRVELFLNGKSQGIRTRNSQDFPAAGLHWNVQFNSGRNVLKAVSRDRGVNLADSICQQYQTAQWGEPDHIALSKVTLDDGRQAIEALLLDKDGNICLDAKDFVTFGCTDCDGLLVDQGTNTGSSLIQLANGRARIVLLRDRDMAVSAEVNRSGKTLKKIIEL